MADTRYEKLAEVIVTHSTRVQQGENVLIEAFDQEDALVRALVKRVNQAGGNPFVNLRSNRVIRELLHSASEAQMIAWAEFDAKQMSMMDTYVGIRGSRNIFEFSDVPAEKLALYHQIYQKKVHIDIRSKKTKWVVLRYPDAAMAQLANMSTEAFEQFYFDVCTMDYGKMAQAMNALKELMERTERVQLIGPGTDLQFSIKGMNAVPCAGELNLPDGEIYTAPVKDSVNGVITFNTPSAYNGFVFEQVSLTFVNGRVESFTANDTERLSHVFDTDEGARYIGEFAIGVNPFIREAMKDILFDEKIDGSVHFAVGDCYDNAYNDNHSSIHWDMVLIQRPEYGGGEMWFDDRLIRKDGRFVVPELTALNPENLR